MSTDLQCTVLGNHIELTRGQWNGRKAMISNYPGLLDEVMKYTWTYQEGTHPYLQCSKLGIYLHKFVLSFLYGESCIAQMLAKKVIIEHLDNDGLNCTFENLHIISDSMNKAKAFSIDEMRKKHEDNRFPISSYIVDVYYSHLVRMYQMQIFFNRDLYFNTKTNNPVEMMVFQYSLFSDLFPDWFIAMDSIAAGRVDVSKFHYNKAIVHERPAIELKEEEKDHVVIERDGKMYLVLRPDADSKFTAVLSTPFMEECQLEEGEKTG